MEKYAPLLKELLESRGIDTYEEAEKFLHPLYEEHMHDPFLMKDMEKSVERILKAIENNEKIVFFTDYDCDGIPAGVILHDFFKKINYTNFENYIPHRHDEGFGLNMEAIEEFGKQKVDLLITADCGITDVEEIERANELGIDVIITDHHLPRQSETTAGLPQELLPNAFAILDPKQEGCNYPEKMLCGSGVVFKLIQGILKNNRFDISEGWEKWLLDMVGMATLSDMVPLTGENRVFAYYGLKVLRKSPRVGLLKLLRISKINQEHIAEEDIGFTISPRINAASRMGIPRDAFRLLATDDEVEAGILAEHLNKINDERKGMVAAMVKEIKKKIEARKDQNEIMKSVLVMGNPNWKPALLGLAANTLMREHERPVFLWGREGGELIKGSCRSDGSVSLVSLMQEADPQTFIDFGGHAMSGGFSVSHEKIHLLEDELERAYEKVREGMKLEKEECLKIDKELSIDEVDWKTYSSIEKLAPYGTGNPKPLFKFSNVSIYDVKQFGKEKNHLEITFKNFNDKKIPAISFFTGDNPSFLKLKKGDTITLLAHFEKSMFRNFPELRLRIVDIIQ